MKNYVDIFDFLSLAGGLVLFLYGMALLSKSLKALAGGKLSVVFKHLTNSRLRAVLLGAGITALIQSSSAATVMVAGLVDAGIIQLSQAVGVIIGANVGTTLTPWLLCLAKIESGGFFTRLVQSVFSSPVPAMAGVFFLRFAKKGKRRDAASALLGFVLLMAGMNTMSRAMHPLVQTPWFAKTLIMFDHPLSGLAAGTLLTAVIQSSSASVGILQAMCSTKSVSYGAALPVILGQNIGTCATAMLSAIGAGRNAKRASLIHLLFNLIGAAAFMTLFYGANKILHFSFLHAPAGSVGIALIHTGFNLLASLLILPFSDTLEKLSFLIIRPKENRFDAGRQIVTRKALGAKKFPFSGLFLWYTIMRKWTHRFIRRINKL